MTYEADAILRDIVASQREMIGELKAIRGLLSVPPANAAAAPRAVSGAREHEAAPAGSSMDIAARTR